MPQPDISNTTHSSSINVIRGAGPCDLQQRLVTFVLERARTLGAEAGKRPLRILVASGTMRNQLVRVLAHNARGALLGVEVQNFLPLVESILKRAGRFCPSGEQVFEVLLRRVARERPFIEEKLGDLADGVGLLSRSVRDLLGAGLDGETAAKIHPELEGDREGEWASELLGISEQVAEELNEKGVWRRAGRLALAAEVLKKEPKSCPVTDRFFLYGIADAPGTTLDFFRALSQVAPLTLFLDLPPDAYGKGLESVGCAYPRRLAQQLGAAVPEVSDVPSLPCERTLKAAADRASEVREMAWCIRDEIASGGVSPEAIMVAVSDLAAYGPTIRHQFDQLALPYTTPSIDSPLGVAVHLSHGWQRLLERQGLLEVDDFLELLTDDESRSTRQSQSVAFRMMGSSRLSDLALLDVSDFADERTGKVRLPVYQARQVEDATSVQMRKRTVDAQGLVAIVALAKQVLKVLDTLPSRGPSSDFEAALGALGELSPGVRINKGVRDLLAAPSKSLPDGFVVSPAEFIRLFTEAVAQSEEARLHGEGGGVVVVGWGRARSCSAESLYVLGLNRGVLPRQGGREDSFLPDSVRRLMQRHLPDLSLKGENEAESQHFFASLLSAAPKVALSWLTSDDQGKALQPSPYLQRLFVECPAIGKTVSELPVLRDEQLRTRDLHELPLEEAVQLSALHGAYDVMVPLLQAMEPEAAAAAQVRTVQAMETREQQGSVARLGQVAPWRDSPLARDELSATFLEAIAKCPWKAYLERVLRLSPLPDATTKLPSLSPLAIGNSVHNALEQIVTQVEREPELLSLLAGDSTPVLRPSDEQLALYLHRAVEGVVLNEGLDYPGVRAALFERAMPMVMTAIDAHWVAEDPVSVVGVELTHKHKFTDATGETRTLTFKADRVDLEDDRVFLLDYKTGKACSKKAVGKGLTTGRNLQAALYAASSKETERASTGTYLYIGGDLETRSVESDSPDADASFQAVVTEILRALDGGHMPARILSHKPEGDGDECGYCEMKQACSLRDISHRERLVKEVGEGRLPPEFQRIWALEKTANEEAVEISAARELEEDQLEGEGEVH